MKKVEPIFAQMKSSPTFTKNRNIKTYFDIVIRNPAKLPLSLLRYHKTQLKLCPKEVSRSLPRQMRKAFCPSVYLACEIEIWKLARISLSRFRPISVERGPRKACWANRRLFLIGWGMPGISRYILALSGKLLYFKVAFLVNGLAFGSKAQKQL